MAQVTATLLAKSASTANVAANTNVTVTIGTTGVSTGQWYAVWVAGGGSAPVFTVTNSGTANTYAAKTQVISGASGAIETGQWFVVEGATNALTASTSTIGVQRNSAGSLTWQAYLLNNALSYDLTGTQYTGSSNTATTAMAVSSPATNFTTVAETLTLFGCTWGNTNAGTAGTGFTILDLNNASGTGNPRGAGVFYRQSTSGETVTPAATITTAGNSFAGAALAFSSAGGGTSVTGTLAATATVSATAVKNLVHPTLAIIGDSLTYRSGNDANPPSRESTTRGVFETAGIAANDDSMYWYGVGGKPMVGNDSAGKSMADCITAAKAQLGTPDTWIIAVGTNDVALSDSAFQAGMDAVMSAIGTSGHVYWMNLTFFNVANTNAAHFNPIMATQIATYTNASLLDFNTYIHSAGVYDTADWISPVDATHMTTQGWAKRDAFIANQIAATTGALAATATISATVAPRFSATGSITATGALSAAVTPTNAVIGSLTATGTLSATVVKIAPTTGTLAATGALSATTQAAAAGSITATGTLSALVGGGGNVSGSLTATAAVSATVVPASPVTGTLAATASLAATTVARIAVTGNLAATAALSALVTSSGSVTANLTATASLGATVVAVYTRTGSLTATGAVSAVVSAVAPSDGHAVEHAVLTLTTQTPQLVITAPQPTLTLGDS